MAEEDDSVSSGTRGDAAAVGLALNAGATADEARTYLREQTELARLQKQNLIEQNAFELSHLRWRRLNDQMRGFLQMMAVALGAVVVIAVAATLWSASRSEGLVIEPISTPPALAQRGLTGTTIAARLLDALTAMQEKTSSARAAASFRNNWTSDIKVEIPETGLSLGQVFDYLRDWLGHEQHLSGELTENASSYELTTRLGGQAGVTVTGEDLDVLVQKAAEAIFLRAQPYRYSRYVAQAEHDGSKAIAVLQSLTRTGDSVDRAWAWSGVSLASCFHGDFVRALDGARRSQAIDPNNPISDKSFAYAYYYMGRSEDELSAYRRMTLHTGAATASIAPELLPVLRAQAEESVAILVGDYQAAFRLDNALTRMPDYQGSIDTAAVTEALDLAEAHDTIVIPDPSDRADASTTEFARGVLSRNLGDWRGVVLHMKTAEADWYAASHAYNDPKLGAIVLNHVFTGPEIAYAEARLGHRKEAERDLSELRPDCYACAQAHGLVVEAEGEFGRAGWWFAHATSMAPSLPFAETDWGEMLLRHGSYDGAIEKFESAHAKGPHFADPLELWGEVLIARNRSDLALAKFAEAARYAPNWGRLHLKWGEALLWSGDKDGAQKQFAIARALTLAVSEQSGLARMAAAHV